LFYFFRSTHVPVGHDQLQHIELSRDLANLFNKRYGETFLLPEPILTNTARIMSLRRPQEKMSKSDKSINSRIDLTDSNDSIALKIQKSLTDETQPTKLNRYTNRVDRRIEKGLNREIRRSRIFYTSP